MSDWERRGRQLQLQVADLERQRDDAYRSLAEAGVKARELRQDVARHQDTIEGLAEALRHVQQCAATPDGDPADILADLADGAARALTLALAHTGAQRAQPEAATDAEENT